MQRVRSRLWWREAGRSLVDVSIPVAVGCLVATLLRRVGTLDLRVLVLALAGVLVARELLLFRRRLAAPPGAAHAIDGAADRAGLAAHDAVATSLEFADLSDPRAALTRERARSVSGRIAPGTVVPMRPGHRRTLQLAGVGATIAATVLVSALVPVHRSPEDLRRQALARYIEEVQEAATAGAITDPALAESLEAAGAAGATQAALTLAASEVQAAVARLAETQAALERVREVAGELRAAAAGDAGGGAADAGLTAGQSSRLADALGKLAGSVPEDLLHRLQAILEGAPAPPHEEVADALDAVAADGARASGGGDPLAIASLSLRENVARQRLNGEDLAPAVGAGTGGMPGAPPSGADPSGGGALSAVTGSLDPAQLARAMAALAPRSPPPGSATLVDRYFAALEHSR